MKTFVMMCACLGLAAGMAAPGWAQEQQPTAREQKLAQEQKLKALDAIKTEQAAIAAKQAFIDAAYRPAAPAKMEKVSYCGVSTEEVTPALTAQLKLPKGMGLLVSFVEAKSPAEAAGIKQYDVLLKFNDQLLTNSDQLRALVRMKMPSDDVKFALIRQGQPADVNVELGQKETEVQVEAAVELPPYHPFIFNKGQPNGQFMIDDGAFNAWAGGGGGGGRGGGGGVAFTNITGNGKNQMVWRDPQNTLNLELKDGKAITLQAKDRAGKEVFNGPVETEDQRKALPAELMDKLQKAEAGGPMRVQRGRAAAVDTRSHVLTSSENDTLMVARFDKEKATYVFAFSTADGKTLFDGPTANDAERKALPDAVARQLETLEKNQGAAAEFGQIGRN